MDKSNRNIEEYIDTLPEEAKADMESLHVGISNVMAGLPTALYEGKFWGGSSQEIIGYGSYTYQRSDKLVVEWFIVGLALQKNYISVYINAVEDREYLSEKYGKDIGKVKVGKSSISFASLADIDLGKLLAIVAKARDLTA